MNRAPDSVDDCMGPNRGLGQVEVTLGNKRCCSHYAIDRGTKHKVISLREGGGTIIHFTGGAN